MSNTNQSTQLNISLGYGNYFWINEKKKEKRKKEKKKRKKRKKKKKEKKRKKKRKRKKHILIIPNNTKRHNQIDNQKDQCNPHSSSKRNTIRIREIGSSPKSNRKTKSQKQIEERSSISCCQCHSREP